MTRPKLWRALDGELGANARRQRASLRNELSKVGGTFSADNRATRIRALELIECVETLSVRLVGRELALAVREGRRLDAPTVRIGVGVQLAMLVLGGAGRAVKDIEANRATFSVALGVGVGISDASVGLLRTALCGGADTLRPMNEAQSTCLGQGLNALLAMLDCSLPWESARVPMDPHYSALANALRDRAPLRIVAACDDLLDFRDREFGGTRTVLLDWLVSYVPVEVLVARAICARAGCPWEEPSHQTWRPWSAPAARVGAGDAAGSEEALQLIDNAVAVTRWVSRHLDAGALTATVEALLAEGSHAEGELEERTNRG